MKMQIVKSDKPYKATWSGERAECTVHHFDSKRFGLRMVVHKWLDRGVTTYKFCDGDGRSDDFTVHLEASVYEN
jgi:hypothetical protein